MREPSGGGGLSGTLRVSGNWPSKRKEGEHSRETKRQGRENVQESAER